MLMIGGVPHFDKKTPYRFVKFSESIADLATLSTDILCFKIHYSYSNMAGNPTYVDERTFKSLDEALVSGRNIYAPYVSEVLILESRISFSVRGTSDPRISFDWVLRNKHLFEPRARLNRYLVCRESGRAVALSD